MLLPLLRPLLLLLALKLLHLLPLTNDVVSAATRVASIEGIRRRNIVAGVLRLTLLRSALLSPLLTSALLLLLLQLRSQLLLTLLFSTLFTQLLCTQILLFASAPCFKFLLFGTRTSLFLTSLIGGGLTLSFGLQTRLLVVFSFLKASQLTLCLLLQSQSTRLIAVFLQSQIGIIDRAAIVLFAQASLASRNGLIDHLLIMFVAKLSKAIERQDQESYQPQNNLFPASFRLCGHWSGSRRHSSRYRSRHNNRRRLNCCGTGTRCCCRNDDRYRCRCRWNNPQHRRDTLCRYTAIRAVINRPVERLCTATVSAGGRKLGGFGCLGHGVFP